MKLVKVINGTYKAPNGKEYESKSYRLVLPNGLYIVIKPAFNQDYTKLELLANETIEIK